MKTIITLLFILSTSLQLFAQNNYLKKSFKKSVQPELTLFQYKEKLNELGHNTQPWETTKYNGKGLFGIANNTFIKQDTLLSSNGRNYFSSLNIVNDTLLFVDYGDKDIIPMNEDMYFEKIINSSRYSPSVVLSYFQDNAMSLKPEISKNQAKYTKSIGKYTVELFINTETQLVDKISFISYDELYGDVKTTFVYSSYETRGNIKYPSNIMIVKINGQIIDEVLVLANDVSRQKVILLEKPKGFKLIEKVANKPAEIAILKYNEYIHFIELKYTDDRILVVEFDDYMLVAEAPLNPKNGELIILEVKKIAPNKPIKYFVFGHHHPHYLGGIRAFVHKGATILSTEKTKDYVDYIVSAKHTLEPDSLQLQPKQLKTQIIKDRFVIDNKMVVYSIGEKSAHTLDYLIYYFPQEKLLFQDDLCSIPIEGPITKASKRQIGLYNSIKELNLEVETIVQSWPVNGNKVKTIFPFSDLEKSMK